MTSIIASTLLMILLIVVPICATASATDKDDNESFPNTASSFVNLQQQYHRQTIVGGTPTEPMQYSFMALIEFDNDRHPICGGTLVAPNVVLSARHCFENVVLDDNDTLLEEGYDRIKYVVLGEHDRRNTSHHEEYFSVIELWSYPTSFDERNNDFTLLKLNGTSSYTPVTLDDGTELQNTITIANDNNQNPTLTVLGWGWTRNYYNYKLLSHWLRQVQVQYISNRECNQIYCEKSSIFLSSNCNSNYITRNMMCAYSEGRDACDGDSGGPLLLIINDTSTSTTSNASNAIPKVFQVGVVSWGEGCASELPGVYAKLSFGIISWINRYINSINGDDSNESPTVSPFSITSGTGSITKAKTTIKRTLFMMLSSYSMIWSTAF